MHDSSLRWKWKLPTSEILSLHKRTLIKCSFGLQDIENHFHSPTLEVESHLTETIVLLHQTIETQTVKKVFGSNFQFSTEKRNHSIKKWTFYLCLKCPKQDSNRIIERVSV